MSDVPPAEGWWKASDGNWYPPQPPAPPPAEPPTPPLPAAPASAPGPAAPGPAAPAPTQPFEYGTQAGAAATSSYGAQPVSGQPSPYGAQYSDSAMYGVPPIPPPATGKSRRRLLIGLTVLIVLALVAVVAIIATNDGSESKKSVDASSPGSGGKSLNSTGTSTSTVDESMPADAPNIIGADGSTITPVVARAIVDLQKFWNEEFPKTFPGKQYDPVKGGFYSVSPSDPLPPCATQAADIAGNAYYCAQADVVAWDDTQLLPDLQKTYGDLSVAVVIAHEWGHAVQARSGMQGKTVTLEHQADCYAGAYVAHLTDEPKPTFEVDASTVDEALAGFIELRDTPGTSAEDASAHGSAFDRVNAFEDGIDNGASQCATYTDDSITLVEIPFTDQADVDNSGNLPYDQTIPLASSDLEDYFSQVFAQLPGASGKAWTPLAGVNAFQTTGPKCGADDTNGFALYYCAADDTIEYQDSTMRAIHDGIGDYAVATVIGTQYGLAVQNRLGLLGGDAKQQNITADCLTGAWSASVFKQDRATAKLSLSPGDLDETVEALLAFGSTAGSENSKQGAGFQRVESFRKGLLEGVVPCLQK